MDFLFSKGKGSPRNIVVTHADGVVGFAIVEKMLPLSKKLFALLSADGVDSFKKHFGKKVEDGTVVLMPVDMSDQKTIQAAFAVLNSQYGGVEILINASANVVVPTGNTQTDHDFAGWILDNCLKGPICASQCACDFMMAAKGGIIVHVTTPRSPPSDDSVPSHYAALLHTAAEGLTSYCHSRSPALAKHNITMSTIGSQTGYVVQTVAETVEAIVFSRTQNTSSQAVLSMMLHSPPK